MKCTNYNNLLRLLDQYLLSQEEFIVYWDNGLIFRGYSSTGSEVTYCLLDENDPLYDDGVHYWAGVMVLEIIQQAREKMEYPCVEGEGWAIDPWGVPSKITSISGQVLWAQQTDKSNWRLTGR